MDNVVTYVFAKFGDDLLWNEKALADCKSDNNAKNKNKNKNNVADAWEPVPGVPVSKDLSSGTLNRVVNIK